MPRAAEVFERAGVPSHLFSEEVTPDEIDWKWWKHRADLLITGTSHQAPFEAVLWELARRQPCPSLALLDQWCNLPLRFQHGQPDYVGAIDVVQADDLIRMGFSPEKVLVVGHPWLTDLLERCERQACTPKTQEDREAVCVLFVSESIAADVANGKNLPYGFDEIDSFDVLYRAACQAGELGTKVSLAVKFHPYENPARFRDFLNKLSPPPLVKLACAPQETDPRSWVLWSDLVVGISSMLLFEAMVLGRPVVSVQPGLAREDTFRASVNGYARTLTDPAEAVTFLTRLIQDPQERRAVLAGHRSFTGTLRRNCFEPVLGWIRARCLT